MLQEHLGRPFAINGRKLLLCLNTVAATCEKLPFLSLLYDVCQSRYTVRRTAALRRCACSGLGLKGFVGSCQTGYGGVCLLHGLLDRCVAVKLAPPCLQPACQRAVPPGGQNRYLCRAVRLAVVLAHQRFMCGKFPLNQGAVIAGSAFKLL